MTGPGMTSQSARRLLVLGGSGQLGYELIHRAWPAGVEVTAPERDALDILDPEALGAAIRSVGAKAVINAAAYTAVDKAESETAAAFAANAHAPAAIAEAARIEGVPLIHVSTDYVFDGRGSAPYEVDHPVAPLNVYGASKAAGELAVRFGQPRSAIVRTSWLVSARRSNFVRTMLRLGQSQTQLRVVADQHGAPTLASDLADAIAAIALRMIEDETAPTGLFHFSNAGATTWAGFAGAIFEAAAARGIPTPTIAAISTADYPTPARRPAYSVLSTTRIERDYGVTPAPWRERLPALVDEILGEAS